MKHNPIETPDLVAGLSGEEVNGDYVSGLHGSFAPTDQAKCRGTASFCGPMCDVTFVILHFEHDNGMRISPLELGHGRILEGDHLVGVRRAAVMCMRRATNG